MRDYIHHGENGILYTPGSTDQIDPTLIRESRKYRQQQAVEGYEELDKRTRIKLNNSYTQFTFIRLAATWAENIRDLSV